MTKGQDKKVLSSTALYSGAQRPVSVSVTALIDNYCQPFDKDFWSSYKVLAQTLPEDLWKVEKIKLLTSKKFSADLLDKYQINPEEFTSKKAQVILDWERENQEACERGTAIHKQIEDSLYKQGVGISMSKFGASGEFCCTKDYSKLDLQNGVYPEYSIAWSAPNSPLCLIGQADLLIKQGNDIIIVDHKTSKKIESKGFFNYNTKRPIKMKFPLHGLDDCNFYHYALQLSTYAWLLQQKNPEFVVKDLIINHFGPNGDNKLHHVPYLKDEVGKMVRHYERVLTQKMKYAEIEY